MKQNQVKWGVILSYVLIIFNTVYGLAITPYMLGCLGDAEYGVYKTIASLTASLMVLDMGIGSTVMRYVAKYKAEGENEKIPNYVAMNLVLAAILGSVILAVGAGIFQTIRPSYSATFTEAQISKAQLLFALLIGNMVLHVFENVLNGVISGHNHFMFGNGVKVMRLLARTVLVLVLLRAIPNAVVLVLIDIGVTLLFLIAELFYCKRVLCVKIKLTHWEKKVFWESGKYTILMFLTAVVTQVNKNLDNVMIGAFYGPEMVTVYSMGLLIFGMYESLSTSISGVMLPTVTNILEQPDGEKAITKLIVRVGRVQFMLMGAALTGFALLGKDFLSLWLGKEYLDAYVVALILMLPAMLELCVNVCLSILRAKNKLGFRTTVVSAVTVLNLVITFFAVKYWSYIGAAFGTAVSYILGSVLVMNIYYKKKFCLPMLRIYGQIFSRTWVCLLVAGGALWGYTKFFHGTTWSFIGGVVVFVAAYGSSLLLYGFSREEKQMLKIGGKKK